MLCTNYGFRNQKSTWSAIETLKTKAQGFKSNYAIEGDIVGTYNHVNHNYLLKLIKMRITDNGFLKRISSMLKSEIIAHEKYENALTGTPQSGIVSPL